MLSNRLSRCLLLSPTQRSTVVCSIRCCPFSSTSSFSPTPLQLHTIDSPAKQSSSSAPPPLLITHGLLGSCSNWRGIAQKPELSSTRRVITCDLRNHGASPHTPDMTLPAMAADLVKILDDKQINTCTGMGHSLGGKAMMAAALLFPSHFSGVIIVDVSPYDYGHEQQQWSGVAHVVKSLNKVDLRGIKSRDDVDVQLRPLIRDTATRSFVLQNVVQDRDKTFRWRLNLPVLTSNLAAMSLFPISADHPYTGPTLFVRGEYSDFIMPEQYPAMKKYFPNYELVTIPKANHWVHADQPETFVKEVNKFLNKHSL